MSSRTGAINASDATSKFSGIALEDAEVEFGRKISPLVVVTLVAALLLLIIVSFVIGRFSISIPEIFEGIYNHLFRPETVDPYSASYVSDYGRIDAVLFSGRGPRIMVVCLVGAALAVSGASYQGMFKNPLVSPDILGSSTGASFGACLALLLNLDYFYTMLFAFLGGMAAVGLAVLLNRIVKYDPTLGLVLGGILVSSLFSSGTSFIKLVADGADKLPAITFWLMGSFNRITASSVPWWYVPVMAVGFVILIIMARRLNVLSFGDEEARAMGINTRSTRLLVIFASTLLASLSVAVAGVIGYVGLVVPHLARAIVGPNYKVLLPTSMFVGASFLLVIDNIARVAMPVEIPIGILTAIVGVPFFVVIFRSQMRGWR